MKVKVFQGGGGALGGGARQTLMICIWYSIINVGHTRDDDDGQTPDD